MGVAAGTDLVDDVAALEHSLLGETDSRRVLDTSAGPVAPVGPARAAGESD